MLCNLYDLLVLRALCHRGRATFAPAPEVPFASSARRAAGAAHADAGYRGRPPCASPRSATPSGAFSSFRSSLCHRLPVGPRATRARAAGRGCS